MQDAGEASDAEAEAAAKQAGMNHLSQQLHLMQARRQALERCGSRRTPAREQNTVPERVNLPVLPSVQRNQVTREHPLCCFSNQMFPLRLELRRDGPCASGATVG